MNIQDALSFLRRRWFFSILNNEELDQFIKKAKLFVVKTGEVVFNQGDDGNEFYFVYSGKIRIFQINQEDKEINLGFRTRGDHFGETAIISSKPRNATARAVEDSVLVSIDSITFNQLFFAKPQIRDYFDKFIKYTSIHQFLKSCSHLSSLPPTDLQELIRNFNFELFSKGDIVFRQGTAPDKFYLIELGKLKVVRWEDDKQEIINFLREGDIFGEKALVEETERHADVICLTDCHLFSITKESFEKLIERSPKLAKIIRDRIESYHTDKPPIPYREMIKQELEASKETRIIEPVVSDESQLKGEYYHKLASLYARHIRFPFIPQIDELSCGTTCIMMIARYYGKNFSSSRLRDLAHVDLSGSSMANLAFAAERLGFSARGIRLDYDKLMSLHLPCIIHWRGFHYIVLYKISESHVWVADPAVGLRKYARKHFINNWRGISLLITPTSQFKKQKEDPSSFKKIFEFISPYRSIIFEIFLASCLFNILGLATPIFLKNIIDKALFYYDMTILNLMAVGTMIILIFRFAVGLLRQYLTVHTTMRIDLSMLVSLYKHLMSLPLGYFKARKLSDFISRLGDNEKVRYFLSNIVLTLTFDTILIVIYFSVMFYYNAQVAALAALSIPVFAAITIIFTPFLKKLDLESAIAKTDSNSIFLESITGIDVVKSMNTEYLTRWKWEDKFINSLNIDYQLLNKTMAFNSLGDLFFGLFSTLILWFGAYKVIGGMMSAGELMAFMVLMGGISTLLKRFAVAWKHIQRSLVAIDRHYDVFISNPQFPGSLDSNEGIVIKKPEGNIIFKNVFFRYGGKDNPYILSNINFNIMPNQRIAIIGRSGSGKTTLANLICRLYDCSEGKILIDGYDIANMNLMNLRSFVGLVPQKSFLFNGSIRENISSNDPEETIDKITAAAKLACAHDFIFNLPRGYNTKVGECGTQLSESQKQRIAIARVLYRNPKIIILDEATNSMDIESESAFHKNISAILKDKTAIIITHKLKSVKNADRIVVIDDGELVEQGTHDELMNLRGLYHYLFHQELIL